ncbi:hypothetical protein CDV31_007997 [Fusarium ambrosium]|uniref:Peptidase S8/S53 domain-containing protein n=1 Tax=Fusarium ambrosium TaxID=131363 RepID=A0A428U3S3_9HYPO|nr:hypothetical protein CDV31_007997 [Fusarium ambrosium]
MICNKDENPVYTAKRLVQLVIESIDNSNEAESLALVNSRAALDFQLRLALLELDLGKDQTLPQNDQQLSGYALSLRRVLVDFFGTDIDSHLKTGSRHQGLQAALAQNSHDEAKSRIPSSIGLPETPQALAQLERQLLSLRKPNSSRPAVSHHRTTTREDPDVNKVDESEIENEGRAKITANATLLSRNGRDPDSPTAGGVPVTFEPPDMTDEQKLSKEFMKKASEFYREKIERIKGKRAIKVAVLDTGVDKTETHFRGVRGGRGTSIKETQSFIEGTPHDKNGHGTQVAALVVAVAPHVDLYIAKVSETKEGRGVDQWVKAINWAMELKVDIINISARAPDKKEIRKPIEDAERQGIIILAAASNDGANLPRAFPARMDRVLAIHATDGHGNPSGFNPSPLDRDVNFSTLGAHIPSPLLGAPRFLDAGTSFSTAIAAGMAANILTLVENVRDESKGDDTQWYLANRMVGMKAIFKGFSVVRDGYDYLSPWKLDDMVDDVGNSWLKRALKNL